MIPRVYLFLSVVLLATALPLHAQWTQVHITEQPNPDWGWCSLQHEGVFFVGGAFGVQHSTDNGATCIPQEEHDGNRHTESE